VRIKFACPHCDHVCRVPAEFAGKQGRCPECRKGLEVPTESTLQSHRADARRSAQGKVELRDDMISSQGPIEGAQEGKRHCRHCNRQIDMNTTTCPHCGGDAALTGAPWQVIVALCCVIPFPLPGLIFGQFGLIAARKRGKYVNLAWTAVGLNATWLLFNVVTIILSAMRG
jgi:Zn finger protein HypA/HybF involved in hydrogenase expression